MEMEHKRHSLTTPTLSTALFTDTTVVHSILEIQLQQHILPSVKAQDEEGKAKTTSLFYLKTEFHEMLTSET